MTFLINGFYLDQENIEIMKHFLVIIILDIICSDLYLPSIPWLHFSETKEKGWMDVHKSCLRNDYIDEFRSILIPIYVFNRSNLKMCTMPISLFVIYLGFSLVMFIFVIKIVIKYLKWNIKDERTKKLTNHSSWYANI